MAIDTLTIFACEEDDDTSAANSIVIKGTTDAISEVNHAIYGWRAEETNTGNVNLKILGGMNHKITTATRELAPGTIVKEKMVFVTLNQGNMDPDFWELVINAPKYTVLRQDFFAELMKGYCASQGNSIFTLIDPIAKFPFSLRKEIIDILDSVSVAMNNIVEGNPGVNRAYFSGVMNGFLAGDQENALRLKDIPFRTEVLDLAHSIANDMKTQF